MSDLLAFIVGIFIAEVTHKPPSYLPEGPFEHTVGQVPLVYGTFMKSSHLVEQLMKETEK